MGPLEQLPPDVLQKCSASYAQDDGSFEKLVDEAKEKESHGVDEQVLERITDKIRRIQRRIEESNNPADIAQYELRLTNELGNYDLLFAQAGDEARLPSLTIADLDDFRDFLSKTIGETKAGDPKTLPRSMGGGHDPVVHLARLAAEADDRDPEIAAQEARNEKHGLVEVAGYEDQIAEANRKRKIFEEVTSISTGGPQMQTVELEEASIQLGIDWRRPFVDATREDGWRFKEHQIIGELTPHFETAYIFIWICSSAFTPTPSAV